MNVVVDTNVAIVANGTDIHVSMECKLACINKLEYICKEDIIYMDNKDQIFREYNQYLSLAGQPGTGDIFFKHINDNRYMGKKVAQVSITANNNPNRGFDELPTNQLDPSDRKFLAVAVVSRSKIINACDSDWDEQRDLLVQLRIEIEQICPQHGLVNNQR